VSTLLRKGTLKELLMFRLIRSTLALLTIIIMPISPGLADSPRVRSLRADRVAIILVDETDAIERMREMRACHQECKDLRDECYAEVARTGDGISRCMEEAWICLERCGR